MKMHCCRRSPARLPGLLLLAAALGAAATVQARSDACASAPPPDAALRYVAAPQSFVLTIARVPGREVSVYQEERELLVMFSGTVPALDADLLRRCGAHWIDGVTPRHDALRLRMAPGVEVDVASRDAALTLRFAAAGDLHDAPAAADTADAADAGVPVDDGEGARRLELLRARLLQREQRYAEARERFAALRDAWPERSEPLAGLAEIEAAAGRWRRSAELHRAAAGLGSSGSAAALLAIEREQASRAVAAVERRRSAGVGPGTAQAMTLARLGGAWRRAEAWWVGAEAVSVRFGAAGARRQRADLTLRHDALAGGRLDAHLFLADGGAGWGLEALRGDDHGTTRAGLDWARPHWDTIEGVAAAALRDRLFIERRQRLGPGLQAQVRLGVNRYRTRAEGSLGRSTEVGFELRADAPIGPADLSLAYAIDGEYLAWRRDDAETPLALAEREVHSIALDLAGDVGAYRLGGRVGFGQDRYGRFGTLAGVALGYSSGPLEMRVDASRVRDIGHERGTSDSVGARFMLVF